MMASREDVQGFIDRLENSSQLAEEVDEGLWVLAADGDSGQIVINYAPPVVVVRVNVMELPAPEAKRNELMRKLLELNAGDLTHGAYGIEGSSVVLTDAMQIDDLSFHEFQATIDSINLALGSHLSALATYQE
jgi:hypothetical protein